MFDIDKILGNKKSKKNVKFTDMTLSNTFGKNPFSDIVGNITKKPLKNMGASDYMQNKWKHMNAQQRSKARKKYKDSDGDRVPNIFDCNPFNAMRQDWKMPEGFNSKGIDKYGRKIVYVPVEEAYYMRGRYGKAGQSEFIVDADYKDERELKSLGRNKKWDHDFDVLNKDYGDFDKAYDEAERKKEEDIINYNAQIKKRELEKQGYNVYPYKIGKTKRAYMYDSKKGASIHYRASPKKHEQMVQGVMQPTNFSPGSSAGDRTKKEVKQYYKDMKKELIEGEVPMLEVSDSDIQRRVIGEGRHRILAARELGIREFPIVVDERTAERMTKYPQGLDKTKHTPDPNHTWAIPDFDEESYRTQDTKSFKEEARKEVQAEYADYQPPAQEPKDPVDEELELLLKHKILNDSDNDGLVDVADAELNY